MNRADGNRTKRADMAALENSVGEDSLTSRASGVEYCSEVREPCSCRSQRLPLSSLPCWPWC
ncbi:hypothetical protein EHS39_15890 [Ensifer sp. MPMI2T]|nr:hypothetical protein EHS39_15890 [Ensifer sp. MPMI2T]